MSRFAAGVLAAALASATASPAQVPAVDPALSVDTLPNGLRYYLRPNRAPAHRVELRLVVNAGSTLEDEDQQGFAHYLEHMAFNGTKHFPGHTLIDFLETNGMRFGADVNAHTTPDETVYLLTLPTDDARTLQRGLDVLQDWADGGILIDSAAVVAERGVIMGEWRTRLQDTATQTVLDHYDTVLFGHSRYLSRKPIGDTTLIETATPGPIKRFYHDWYRPDLMTIVVVGDVDQAMMTREIRRRFGSIPAAAAPRPRTVDSLTQAATPEIDVYRGSVLPSLEVFWPAPTDTERLVQDLLSESMEQRILGIRSRPSRPFITAQLEHSRIARVLDVQGFELLAWPDSLERGLSSILTEFERVAQHGIPATRLAHEKAVLLGHLEHAANGETARSSRAYAESYVQHALTGEGSLRSARQELTLAQAILPTVSPDIIAQAARRWRERSGTRIFVRLPALAHVRPPTRETILALLDSIAHTPLASDSDEKDATDVALAAPAARGRIVGEHYDRVAGITEWTLSNGARVLFKPTQNDPDELLIRAWSPGGFAMMPDSLFFTPGRMVARVMTDIGSLGTTNHDALVRQLATTGVRSMQVDIGYADESIRMAGSPKDAETLFQLMHFQFVAPLLDSATLAGWQSLAKYQSTGSSFDDDLNRQFAKMNPRMAPVSTGIAELATVAQLLKTYRDRFSNAGGFTFTLVGAVSPREARPLVERYLANLPATGRREHPVATEDHTYLHRTNTMVATLELPKAQTILVFDGLFPVEPRAYLREWQRLSALTSVLEVRLRTRLRQELGGTYTPFVASHTYAMPEERYRVLIGFDAAPARMHQLNREMMNVLDSIRTHGVTAAEAGRAAAVQRRQLETRLEDNNYWMTTIGTYSRLGIPLDAIPAPYVTPSVTPAEIEATARRFLPSDVYIHFTAMPKDSSSWAKSDDSVR